jgi:hypothetical protein
MSPDPYLRLRAGRRHRQRHRAVVDPDLGQDLTSLVFRTIADPRRSAADRVADRRLITEGWLPPQGLDICGDLSAINVQTIVASGLHPRVPVEPDQRLPGRMASKAAWKRALISSWIALGA